MAKVPALAAAALALLIAWTRRYDAGRLHRVPPHLLNDAAYERDLLSEDQVNMLRDVVRDLRTFPSNSVEAQRATYEHIGEAEPLEADGSCADPFLVPNLNRTLCVLPGRIDIGRHFILTGGMGGLREPYDALVSRVQSFARYMFDLSEYPAVARLFEEDRFLALARRVCPVDKPHLDPFQFNIILQLPGQTVGAHLDAVYFWGATRTRFPQWLLAVMVFSGFMPARSVRRSF